MRYLLLLLLIPSMAWAVPMSACPGGGYVPTANYPTWCPNDVVTINTAPDDTTADISVTSTAATGTTYVSIRLSNTRVHWRAVVNGTGDEASASAAQATTTTTIGVTGLADLTTYYAHVVNVYNNKPSSYEVDEFTTLETTPSATGDAIAGGDDWYFCPDGSNANSGLTHALRKATYPNRAAASNYDTDTDLLSTSHDMWLCTGGIWDSKPMRIARAGTVSDWAETGTYYMDGSTARKALDGVRGPGTTHAKAVIKGGLNAGCATPGNCQFPIPTASSTIDGGLNSQYDAMITIADTADYNEIKNIRVEYARYRGINVQGSGVTESLRYIKIDGVDVGYAGFHAIVVERGVADLVIRNGDYTWTGMCAAFKVAGTSSSTAACTGTWPGTFAMTNRSRRMLVENNDIRDVYGEGIGAFGHATSGDGYLIIRGNRIVNSHSGAIYMEAANIVVENNIILGGAAQQVLNTSNSIPAFSGVGFNNEYLTTGYRNTTNNLTRNNLIVGTQNNLVQSNSSAAITAGKLYGGKWYGNTTVAATVSTARLNILAGGDTTMIEWDFRNNLAWDEGLNAAQCLSGTDTDITVGYNHWSTNPTDGDCDGTGDTYGNTPGISDSTYANWTTIRNQKGTHPVDWPTFADVDPTGGGTVKDAGTPLTTAILDKDNYGFAYEQIAEVLTGSLTEAEWECALCVDAEGTTRVDPPSKGAVE